MNDERPTSADVTEEKLASGRWQGYESRRDVERPPRRSERSFRTEGLWYFVGPIRGQGWSVAAHIVALLAGLAHFALAIFSFAVIIIPAASRTDGPGHFLYAYAIILVLIPGIIGVIQMVAVGRSYTQNRALGWPTEGVRTMFIAAAVTFALAVLGAGFLFAALFESAIGRR